MRYRILLIIISLLVFGLSLSAANSLAGSDPKFTLLVSQSLVDNGTVRLDAYRDKILLSRPVKFHLDASILVEQNGHLYNYFPVGPSILTLPIVGAMRATGMDMRLEQDNFLLQRVLAGLTSVLMVWIIYTICRCFLEQNSSMIIAAVSVLGTSLISTVGTALWTINFSTVFIALSVLLMARYESGKASTVRPIVLGLMLFLAYFSRASSAAFIIAAFGYLFVKERRQFLITAVTSLLFLLVFLGWSRFEYGTWLPAYYSVSRLHAERSPLWIGILGNLLSPSRGIFIFSPFFLLIIPGVLFVGRFLIRQPFVYMMVSWFLLALFLNARAVNWWGGVSFGSRMMTENLLALIVLLALIWSLARQRIGKWAKAITIAAFAVLSIVAIFIHSYQGLFNGDVIGWNQFIEARALPPLTGLGDVFDWTNPQFLATSKRNCDFGYRRHQELLPFDATLEEYQWGDPIRHDADKIIDFRKAIILKAEARLTPTPVPAPGSASPRYKPQSFLPFIKQPGNRSILIGWSSDVSHPNYNLSICQEAQIVFRLGQIDASGQYQVVISAGAHGDQEVLVSINGSEIGSFVNSNPIDQPNLFAISFDGTLLKSGDLNEISLEFPDAKRPRPGFWKVQALAFYWAAIYPMDQTPEWVTAPPPTPKPQGYP